ncbi:MAG TPA: hypothetical protein VHF86_06310 [Xanthomonadaceae bacterium]|nr:hypothetical protein [Xanthomonadaceae bacterium]
MRNDDESTGRATAAMRRGWPVLLALALAACGNGTPTETATPAPAPTPLDPAKTMNPADLKDVTASYRCDEGHRIDIVRDKVARVALSDGRVVKIELVDDSTPPTFMDNGLTLSLLAGDTAELDDEKGHTVTCTKTETARPSPA